MGAVFRARQRSLGRDVAVKIVLAGQFASETDRKRFLAEAEAVARLDHPNIVPVYGIGEHDHRQFYAMKLVDGASLAERIAEFRQPRAAALLLAKLAEAVHHAHQRGVLHRDLKPANVLIDTSNEPFITDFGLARRLDEDAGLTISGAPLGTPAYMSPEQAEGKAAPTTASDIYSLGAILYELLAGSPPFTGQNVAEVLYRIVHEQPREDALRRGRSEHERDLGVIALKCVRKDPSERYASASELQSDLLAWLDRRPIQARRIGNFQRVRLWMQRRPAVATLLLIALLLFSIVTIGAPIAAYRLYESAQREKEAQTQAQARLHESLLAQARALRLTKEPGSRVAGLAALEAAAQISSSQELVDEAIAHLALVDYPPVTNATDLRYWGNIERFSPTMDRVVSWQGDRGVIVLEYPAMREMVQVHRGAPDRRPHLDGFSPDGQKLAFRTTEGVLTLANAATGETLGKVQDAWLGSFSADAKRFSAIVADETMGIYDADTANLEAAWRLPKGSRSRSAFHPDPTISLLAMGDRNQTVLWDWRAQRIVEAIPHEGAPLDIAWTGDFVVTACANGNLSFYNVRTKLHHTKRDQDAGLTGLKAHPSGRFLVTPSMDGSAIWWYTHSGVPFLRDTRFFPTDFSADGTKAGLGSYGSRALTGLILPKSRQEIFSPEAHTLMFTPDGRWLITASRLGLEIFDIASGKRLLSDPIALRGAALLPDGQSLLLAGPRHVRRFGLVGAQETLTLAPSEILYRSGTDDIQAMALSSDGRSAVVCAGMDHVAVISVEEKTAELLKESLIPRGPGTTSSAEWIATGTFHGRGTRVWNRKTGEGRWLATGNANVGFSPDDKYLHSAGSDKLRVYEVGSWKLIYEAETQSGDSLPNVAAWSPSGNLLGYVRKRNEVVLVSAGDWKPMGKLTPPHPLAVQTLAFHPNGAALAVISAKGLVELWDVEGLASELKTLGIKWSLPFYPARLAATPPQLAQVAPIRVQAAIPLGYRREPKQDLAKARGTPVDISRFANARIDQDWHRVGSSANSLAAFGSGTNVIEGLAFRSGGIVQLASENLPQSRAGYPSAIDNIPVNMPASKLHFLIGVGWGGSIGEECGAFRIRLSDGSAHLVPLVVGEQALDWWGGPTAELPAAWHGATDSGQAIRLFMVSWDNPDPALKVLSFDFSSTLRSAAPFLVALTAESSR